MSVLDQALSASTVPEPLAYRRLAAHRSDGADPAAELISAVTGPGSPAERGNDLLAAVLAGLPEETDESPSALSADTTRAAVEFVATTPRADLERLLTPAYLHIRGRLRGEWTDAGLRDAVTGSELPGPDPGARLKLAPVDTPQGRRALTKFVPARMGPTALTETGEGLAAVGMTATGVLLRLDRAPVHWDLFDPPYNCAPASPYIPGAPSPRALAAVLRAELGAQTPHALAALTVGLLTGIVLLADPVAVAEVWWAGGVGPDGPPTSPWRLHVGSAAVPE